MPNQRTVIRESLLKQRKRHNKKPRQAASAFRPPQRSIPPCITLIFIGALGEFYFIRYYRKNSGASRGIRTLDTWFRRPSNENDKLYEIQRIRYRRISCRFYAAPFSFRGLSDRQLRPTLRPAISFPSHTGAPCRCA